MLMENVRFYEEETNGEHVGDEIIDDDDCLEVSAKFDEIDAEGIKCLVYDNELPSIASEIEIEVQEDYNSEIENDEPLESYDADYKELATEETTEIMPKCDDHQQGGNDEANEPEIDLVNQTDTDFEDKHAEKTEKVDNEHDVKLLEREGIGAKEHIAIENIEGACRKGVLELFGNDEKEMADFGEET